MIGKDKIILLTGAAGFIGSYLLGFLNKQGYKNIIIADEFDEEDKWFILTPKNTWQKWKGKNCSTGWKKINQL